MFRLAPSFLLPLPLLPPPCVLQRQMRTSQAKRRDSRHVIVPTPIIFRRLPKGLVVTSVANLFPPQKKVREIFTCI